MKDSHAVKQNEYPDEDETFMRKLVASEEQRRSSYPRLKWIPGQFRWFEANNVVDLWQLYGAKEKAEIYRRLYSRRVV